MKTAETYTHTHTHTHTHTQLRRCRDFLCKLCLGAVLFFTPIFSFSATLPSGYTQLEYIESTGTQYIDTDFVYDNNTRVVWDIQLTAQIPLSEGNNSGVGWVNNNYERLGFSINKDSMLLVYKAYAADLNPAGDTRLATIQVHNNRHVIEINSPVNKAYVDGVEYIFDPAVGDINNDYNLTLPLFAWLGNTGYREYFIGRMYSVKIYDNGTLARNMIPAKRNSDNVVGMYDTVSSTFFTNAGTGSFIAGPVVDTCENPLTIMGTEICAENTQPSGTYLVARQNGNKYYINLSEEENPNNPKPITNESNNVLRIKIGNTIYNAHDGSVE